MPHLADYADRSSMRLNDRLGDRQAHAGALHAIALVRTAIEFIEDKAQFRFTNSGPLVRHVELHEFIFLFRTNRNGVIG